MTTDAATGDSENKSGDDLTHDLWYDGSVRLWQPRRRGLRATSDAVLLAAAIPSGAENHIELGAGTGAATLALAVRCGNARITAVEYDALLANLLTRNIREAGFAERITAMRADIFDPDAAEAWRGKYDLAFCNPPFNDAASSLSHDPMRRRAMAATDEGLGAWVAAGLAALRPGGRLVLISRHDRLHEILAALTGNGAGEITAKPVHSRADAPAIRVLVMARRMPVGKRGGGTIEQLPPLVMRAGDDISPAMHAISHERGHIDLSGNAAALEKSAPPR